MQEKTLFQDWEIEDNKQVPVLLQVFGAVILFHATALGAILYVPQLRDVFYLAQIFANKGNPESREYKKTELDFDDSDVVFVDPDKLFQYPEGYFNDPNDPRFQQESAISHGAINGVGDASSISFDPILPPPTINPTPSYIPPAKSYPQFKQPRNKKTSALPTLPKGNSPFANAGSNSEDKDGDGIPDELTKGNDVAKNKENKSAPKPSPSPKAAPSPIADDDNNNSGFISEPWRDLGNKIKTDKTIDLSNIANLTPTRVEVDALLDGKGKLSMDPKPSPRMVGSGDKNVARFALDIVQAMNDSNMLTYLKAIVGDGKEAQQIKIVLDKGAENFEVVIESDMRAGKKKPDNVASFIKTALEGFAYLKNGEPEAEFIKRVEVNNENGILKIRFRMPNEEAGKLIKKNIEGLDKPKEQGENTAGNSKLSPLAK